MKRIFLLSFVLVSLILPEVVWADLYMPFMEYNPFLFLAIIVLEMLILYWVLGKLLKYPIKIWKIILAVFSANLITYFLGGFVYLLYWRRTSTVLQMEFLVLITSFIVTILVEWLILILFFKTVRKKDLLAASFLMNFVSYSILTYFFVQRFLIK
ncbi:MAG: hypothetical protein NTX82_04420 [Candidatus Parcubacteria bacterium]|nr:hypothetical protein [Candidatus Parcubacteria bacterium]